ncbi:integration host factor, actinobacterial type [Streptomyces sp. N35]|uniref:integration host factor, actinobacterial type n=1 Tax=Streptomyces sp. N35 TaxID=2795730 RepID=UPI0018F565C9|nr:integration host factor, actinobacterial type [Streptomyces sp. N35]
MGLPSLTLAERSAALEKALVVRKERGNLLAGLKSGRLSLGEVLERGDAVVAKTPVRRLLEALPGIGEVRARQLMADLGINERRRVQGLGARQRQRLLELFPSQA